MTERELNRALLARQGLLERIEAPLPEAVERIGAVQAQSWPAVAVALWSRVQGFTPEALHAAMEDGTLVNGIVHRGTVHLVSAREHPMYAGVFEGSGNAVPWRTKAERTADADELRAVIREAARGAVLTSSDVARLAEAWLAEHPGTIPEEELDHQRKTKWRTLLRSGELMRVPSSGTWGSKAPDAVTAAPNAKSEPNRALRDAVLAHLRAFGPAGADDVAQWLGWKIGPVKEALEAADGLEEMQDGSRTVHDLAGAPRPDAGTEAPVRFLAAFDSVILAYAPQRRTRIVPEGRFDAIYNRANLQIRPTFLVDGFVAGTWAAQVKGKKATLTLTPFGRLPRGAKGALEGEAAALLAGLHPAATNRSVAFEKASG